MKKSEMVGLMEEAFAMAILNCKKNSIEASHPMMAVLDAQIKVGMLPPEIDVIHEGHECTENKWEEENE